LVPDRRLNMAFLSVSAPPEMTLLWGCTPLMKCTSFQQDFNKYALAFTLTRVLYIADLARYCFGQGVQAIPKGHPFRGDN
ncbi:MAG TPA: hypothetical protein VGC95_09275, partial [Chitinophagaceae bacterium]